MNTIGLPRARHLAALLCSSLALWSGSALHAAKPAPAAAGSTAYSGRAVALLITGVDKPVSGPIVVCDTGELPTAGGSIDRHASNVNIGSGALTIAAAEAHVAGSGPEAASDTLLTGYKVEFITDEGKHVLIEADYISASVSASVNKQGKASTSSKVVVQGLKVNGRSYAVTGKPNQVIEVPDCDARLIINEQVASSNNGSGDVEVRAIRFEICHCIFGHIGWVHAGITSNGTPPPAGSDCGKLTGGGWITGTPSGAKGTFGVSGGIRRGEFWGHLTYTDHGTGMKVQSTAVTGFAQDAQNANGRIITYAVTINGVAGTARVRAVDNGEPGRDDIFDITLSTGYRAAGDLGGGRPGGGNIQLHKCPPGWE